MRAQAQTIIIDSYLNHSNDEHHLGRGERYEILHHIFTSTDEVTLTAIDYITSLLVSEPCELYKGVRLRKWKNYPQCTIWHMCTSFKKIMKVL